jgi:hypothetical protein
MSDSISTINNWQPQTHYVNIPGSTNTIDQLVYNPTATIPWTWVNPVPIYSPADYSDS